MDDVVFLRKEKDLQPFCIAAMGYSYMDKTSEFEFSSHLILFDFCGHLLLKN